MTSEGLGEMFEGAGKFPLVSMGGGAEGLVCADTGARAPIGASGNLQSKRHLPIPLQQMTQELGHFFTLMFNVNEIRVFTDTQKIIT